MPGVQRTNFQASTQRMRTYDSPENLTTTLIGPVTAVPVEARVKQAECSVTLH